MTQPAQANARPDFQMTNPKPSMETAAPTASNPSLQSPQSPRIQHEPTTASDFCPTSEPSLSATLRNWSPSPTISSLSQNHLDLNQEENKPPSMIQRLFGGSWMQPTIGVTTLLITLIALFVYSHRSFVMAKWTERNDMLQACSQLIEVYNSALLLLQA